MELYGRLREVAIACLKIRWMKKDGQRVVADAKPRNLVNK